MEICKYIEGLSTSNMDDRTMDDVLETLISLERSVMEMRSMNRCSVGDTVDVEEVLGDLVCLVKHVEKNMNRLTNQLEDTLVLNTPASQYDDNEDHTIVIDALLDKVIKGFAALERGVTTMKSPSDQVVTTRDLLRDATHIEAILMDLKVVLKKELCTINDRNVAIFMIIYINDPTYDWDCYVLNTTRSLRDRETNRLRAKYPKSFTMVSITYFTNDPNAPNYIEYIRELSYGEMITMNNTHEIKLKEGYEMNTFIDDVIHQRH